MEMSTKRAGEYNLSIIQSSPKKKFDKRYKKCIMVYINKKEVGP